MIKGKRLIIESTDYSMLNYMKETALRYGTADKIKMEDIL